MKKLIIGCCCMGWLMAGAQNNAIFKGGAGSGNSRGNILQSSANLWAGGTADGFASNRYIQNSASLWLGGTGDGYAKESFSQQSASLWLGGEGDGYTKNGYTQASMSFWLGGAGDGHADTGYTQASASFWKGGGGDGWASTYLPTRALPITLLSFDAEKLAGKYSRLVWKTATETNHHHFEIERGNDGINFTRIATVAGAGNSSSAKNYTLVDSLPAIGFNYYRLKQFDADGRFSYSPARLVRFDEAAGKAVHIYPNPAKDWITIDLSGSTVAENSIINIIAMNGTVVGHIKVPAGSNHLVRFNAAKLPRAMYTVHVVSKSSTEASRIILQ